MSAAPAQPHAWSVQTTLESSDQATTLVIAGRLGSVGATEFAVALESACAAAGQLQLDLEAVDYISSAGLAVLQHAARRQHGAGGRLTLVRMSESVRLALRLGGSLEYLDVESA